MDFLCHGMDRPIHVRLGRCQNGIKSNKHVFKRNMHMWIFHWLYQLFWWLPLSILSNSYVFRDPSGHNFRSLEYPRNCPSVSSSLMYWCVIMLTCILPIIRFVVMICMSNLLLETSSALLLFSIFSANILRSGQKSSSWKFWKSGYGGGGGSGRKSSWKFWK